MINKYYVVPLISAVAMIAISISAPGSAAEPKLDHFRATYSPLHFKPLIDSASDEQCLECHGEILSGTVLEESPAGVRASESIAWYQLLSTYKGEQDTFHRRHLVTELSASLMDLRCNTCHQGNDPRDEAPGTSATAMPQATTRVTLRKHVNPETVCLKCHGPFQYEVMSLPGDWRTVRDQMGNNCMMCHAAIRTNRHQVNYLRADAIEKAGTANSDVCYGCHGGRAWYGISYPYPRHKWDGMPEAIPDWAKDRPTTSEERFLLNEKTDSNREISP